MKLKKWIRRIALLLAGLAVLASVLYFAAQKYAKNRIIAVIEELVGGPVEVDEVRLGREQIEVRGIRVYESASRKIAWLEIDRAVLGLTLGDAIGGETIPESAHIHGAHVVLSFDENGNLLNDFSLWKDGVEMRLRAIDVEDANVEIRQQGRDPLIAKQIDGKIRGATEDVHVQATIGDALNARWNFDAHVQGDSFATKGELTTNQLRFSTDHLARLPFFPRGVTEDLRASGVTPIQLAFQIGEPGVVKFRAALAPRSLNVNISRADLSVANAEGNLVLQNDLVTFTGLQGEIAGGRFSGDGELRLEGQVWNGQVQGKLSDVPLAGLPKKWQVPEPLRGIASGQGTLNFELADSYVEVRGTATATIDEAQLAVIPARPIEIGVELAQLRKLTKEDELTLDGAATVDLDIPDVALIELLKAAEIESNELKDLSGRLGFQATLEIPLATAADPKTYRAQGQLASSDLQFRGIPLSAVQGRFAFEDGIASLRELNTKIAQTGQLSGSVTIAVQPLGNVTSNVAFEGLPVSLIEKFIEKPKASLDGIVSGNVRASVPIQQWKNLDLWQASGRLRSDEVSLDKYHLANVDVAFDVQQGRLAVMSGSANWNGAKAEVAGDLRLKSPCAYSLTASARDLDIVTLAKFAEIKLPIDVSGQANINAKAAGELEPASWSAAGDVKLTNFTVEKLRPASPSAQWQADSRQLTVTSAEAQIFGGNVKLAAEIPLQSESPTKVMGTFSGFDPRMLRQHMPDTPIVVSGKAAGEFTLIGIEKLESATGTLRVRDVAADLKGLRVEDVTVDLSLMRQQVDLQLQGKALGGTVSLNSSALLQELKRENAALPARVSAKSIRLSKVWPLIGQQVRISPPEGVADAQLDLVLTGPSLKPTGVGRLMMQEVRWNGKQLASQFSTSISVLNDSVILRDLTFDYGGGRVTSTVMFRLDELGSGTYSLVLRSVAMRNLLIAFPDLARESAGSVNAAFRGRFANLRVDGSGTVQIRSGRVARIPVRGLDSAVDWAFDVPSRRGKADIRLTRAEISHGRTTGDLSVAWGRQLTLTGKTIFTNVDLRPLARSTDLVSDQITGRISGNVELRGRNVSSLEDFTGSYDLQLANAQPLHLPVLSELTYATGIGSTSKTIADTLIKGRVTRGVIHVDKMTLVAAGIHMFIQGKLTTRGQLDLEVTADTGQLLAVGVVTGIVRPLDWLQRRLVFLHVGGTLRSPVILPQTEKFIQQEVVRFFLPFVITSY